MATIININSSNRTANARDVVQAVNNLRNALGILEKLDGLRAEAIGASQATMASVFSVATNAEAQALSDRWGALLAAWNDSSNTEFAKLRDFINAFNAE